MSTVISGNAANSAAAAATGQANAVTQSLMDSTQDRFLTLLVTQLRNQDPLNPMDNAEVTSQIAQLSTVNGITQLNNTLLALSGQMDVSQSMQAAGLIGKSVLVPGEKIRLGSDPADPTSKAATPFGIDLLSNAASVKAHITDSAGQVVRSIDLGELKEGVHSFQWDGKGNGGAELSDGAYTLRIEALDADEQKVAAQALEYGNVSSVAYSSSGLRIDLGAAGTYSLLDIRKIM